MARLFISYSRKNTDFARRLVGALEKENLDCWVDWDDIPPIVDWPKQIEKGIEEADNFLFVVSPDSIASKICLEELAHAVKNGKRLIPLVPIEIQWDAAPPALSHLNYIFFRESDDFDTSLNKLLTALNTDYDWAQTHRRLQVKALEWERANYDKGFLLRGTDLENAEQQVSIHATTDPLPIALQRAYVLESRQGATRDNRKTISLLVFIIVLLFIFIAALVTPRIQEAIAKTQARGELVLIPEGWDPLESTCRHASLSIL